MMTPVILTRQQQRVQLYKNSINLKFHKNTIKKMQKKLAKYTESLIMKVYT